MTFKYYVRYTLGENKPLETSSDGLSNYILKMFGEDGHTTKGTAKAMVKMAEIKNTAKHGGWVDIGNNIMAMAEREGRR